eukprot:3443249-Heterocapsa_arctica.AAC.1
MEPLSATAFSFFLTVFAATCEMEELRKQVRTFWSRIHSRRASRESTPLGTSPVALKAPNAQNAVPTYSDCHTSTHQQH